MLITEQELKARLANVQKAPAIPDEAFSYFNDEDYFKKRYIRSVEQEKSSRSQVYSDQELQYAYGPRKDNKLP